MKILFIGTVDFSKHALIKLIGLKANLIGVITQKKSSFNADFSDLSVIATSNNIPLHFTEDLNSETTLKWMQNLTPDFIFCFGWSKLLKEKALAIPLKGVIGFHPTALPLNRGRHPIIWTLVLGLKETASTFFFMDEGADSGPILSQSTIQVKYEDDAQSLYEKIIKTAIEQIEMFLPTLLNGTYNKIHQDASKASYWRKRGKNDGEIDWRMSSNAIYNLVRALSKPYVGAHTDYKNKEIKIWKVKEIKNENDNIEPGKVLKSDRNSILVKCYGGAIEIIEHEFSIIPEVDEYI